jgi:FtsX extracellular domain
MTNDLDVTADVLHRALDELAAQLPVTRRDLPTTSPMVRNRPRTWWGVTSVAAALLVIVTATAIALLLSNTTTPSIQASSKKPVQVSPSRLLEFEADVIVYMNVDASQNQIDAIHMALSNSTLVRAYAYVDKAAALADFKQLYRTQPDLTRNITASALPVQYRLLSRSCADATKLLRSLTTQPGTDRVATGSGLPHNVAQRYNDTINPPQLRGRRGRCGQISPTTPGR